MKVHEIRQSFLDYFRARGHTIVESAPVVPQGDPTLLFTNSGMNQFKDVFLGTGQRPYRRAADTQKCIRAGGKHNDLEEVGKDGYHQTFFEMLGNWSFGDYFKAESIEWAWDLLTREWGVDRDRLWVTVHTSDDEARELWPKISGLPRARVLTFGDKDNFWEMGETGPCGPCTEIHIDRGPGRGPDTGVNSGSERFIELWNLVFIQYERRADRSLVPLPERHVDTGMGLERIAQVLQGVYSNYDTDVFAPLVQAVAARSGTRYDQGPAGTPHRAIADHLRALAFSIADGAMPGRTGRGYVLRRILRRASRFFHKLGTNEPALKDLVPALVDTMGGAFPELGAQRDLIARVLEDEEAQFLRTLDRGVAYFEKEKARLAEQGTRTFPGQVVHYLFDTLGFPPDLTAQMAEEAAYKVDLEGFERLREEEREKNRAKGGFKVDLSKYKHAPVTAFTGYEHVAGEARTVAADANELVLDATPFYAESGGQVGDTGRIVTLDGAHELEVHDTRKSGQVIVHVGEWLVGDPTRLAPGTPVMAAVDKARRDALRRNHTGTHLLHWALHQVIGKGAVQKGSEVGATRLRFDFAHERAVGPDELLELERLVNQRIVENHAVQTAEMPLEEARERGAIAMFGEKYGERVRVIDIAGFSCELCGGTHVGRTGDIGAFKIVQEAAVQGGVRRIVALTGGEAVARSHQDSLLLARLTQELKAKPEELLERVHKLQEELKELARKHKAAMRQAAPTWEALAAEAEDLGGVKLVAREVPGDADALRALGDACKARPEPWVGFFVAQGDEGKVPVVCAVSAPLVARGWHSRDLLKPVAALLGGGGGGKPELSSGSGRDAAKIPDALAEARRVVAAKAGA